MHSLTSALFLSFIFIASAPIPSTSAGAQIVIGFGDGPLLPFFFLLAWLISQLPLALVDAFIVIAQLTTLFIIFYSSCLLRAWQSSHKSLESRSRT